MDPTTDETLRRGHPPGDTTAAMEPSGTMKMLLAAATVALGCASGGRYGYARTYVPLDEEESPARRAEEPVYDEVRRAPDQYQGRLLSFFGVVTSVGNASGNASGSTRVGMQQRTHQERHLCEDDNDRTCRVTVNARDGGPFTAVVQLRTGDAAGENRVQTNSLLRVFGTVIQGEYDAAGGPVIAVQYYRHWPRGEYVTTANAGAMRR